MKVVIVQGTIAIRRNFRLRREGEAVFHLRSLIYCAELYSQYRFSSGQRQYSSFLPHSCSVWLLRCHRCALQDTEGHGDNVPVAGEQSQPWWSGLSHWALSCRVLQGQGTGTDPVCAREWQPWEASCELLEQLQTLCWHISCVTLAFPWARIQTEQSYYKVAIAFPFCGCNFHTIFLREYSIKLGTKAGFCSWQCSGHKEQIWGWVMLLWCSPLSELLTRKETWFEHSSWGTSAVLTAQKPIFFVHLCS